MELAKERLENYYSARSLFPEIYSNRDPSSKEMAAALDKMNWFTLPKKTENNLRLSLFW
jgi:hypothetical protein